MFLKFNQNVQKEIYTFFFFTRQGITVKGFPGKLKENLPNGKGILKGKQLTGLRCFQTFKKFIIREIYIQNSKMLFNILIDFFVDIDSNLVCYYFTYKFKFVVLFVCAALVLKYSQKSVYLNKFYKVKSNQIKFLLNLAFFLKCTKGFSGFKLQTIS